MGKKRLLIPAERIERSIVVLCGQKMLLDEDLAEVYGVTTTRLNQQVTRNLERFPEDFSFVLTAEEFANLKLQFATSSSSWGGRRKPPRETSTEQTETGPAPLSDRALVLYDANGQARHEARSHVGGRLS